MTKAPSIKEAWQSVAKRYLDDISDDLPPEVKAPTHDELGDALLAALATLSPPAGDRREAIARIVRKACGSTFLNGYGDENIQRATDEILAGLVQDESGWRTMDSAPKNHFPVLTWSEQGGRCVAFLDVTWTWWPCPATEPLSNKPTHWKPLPAPPIRSARDGGAES